MDKQFLKTTAIMFLNVDGTSDQTCRDDEIVKSLNCTGVDGSAPNLPCSPKETLTLSVFSTQMDQSSTFDS